MPRNGVTKWSHTGCGCEEIASCAARGCHCQTMKLYLLIFLSLLFLHPHTAYCKGCACCCYCIFIVCYLLWHFGIVTFLVQPGRQDEAVVIYELKRLVPALSHVSNKLIKFHDTSSCQQPEQRRTITTTTICELFSSGF